MMLSESQLVTCLFMITILLFIPARIEAQTHQIHENSLAETILNPSEPNIILPEIKPDLRTPVLPANLFKPVQQLPSWQLHQDWMLPQPPRIIYTYPPRRDLGSSNH